MLRKRDKRRLAKEKQIQRSRTPDPQTNLNRLLEQIRQLREQAITDTANQTTSP